MNKNNLPARSKKRAQFPAYDDFLTEVNDLLKTFDLPVCNRLEQVEDSDTANPTAIGYSTKRKYAIKVCCRFPDNLEKRKEFANTIKKRTSLPIPMHLCSSSGKLPLMIMEYLPGVQIRKIIENSALEVQERAMKDLARCLAVFHDPNLLALVENKPDTGDFVQFWLNRIQVQLRKLVSEKAISEKKVNDYLDIRKNKVPYIVAPGLTKVDQDLRDFLADEATGVITGMLDWESVIPGDTIHEISLIFLRLWIAGKTELWKNFRDSYAASGGLKISQHPQIEFYLLARSILASSHSERALELSKALLNNKPIDFA